MNLCRKQSAEFMIFLIVLICEFTWLEKANIWADVELVLCQKDGMTKGRTRQFCYL